MEKDKFDAIISNMGEGVVIIDKNLKILYANKWIESQLKGDSLNTLCLEIFNRSKKFHAPTFSETKQEVQSIEIEGIDNRSFLVTCSELTDGEGDSELLAIIRDVTQKKKYDEQRLEAEKLQAAISVARAIAHELNQPLTGITGYCSLLEEEMIENEKYYKEIKEICKQAIRLGELIKKFQQIVRLEMKEYLGKDEILDVHKSSSENHNFSL